MYKLGLEGLFDPAKLNVSILEFDWWQQKLYFEMIQCA